MYACACTSIHAGMRHLCCSSHAVSMRKHWHSLLYLVTISASHMPYKNKTRDENAARSTGCWILWQQARRSCCLATYCSKCSRMVRNTCLLQSPVMHAARTMTWILRVCDCAGCIAFEGAPFAAGATTYRTNAVAGMLHCKPSVVRGNASEVLIWAVGIGHDNSTMLCFQGCTQPYAA